MLTKIVTNTTGSAIELTRIGVTLQPATPYTIQPALYPFWAQYSGIGSQVATLVTSGDVTVSDGLTPTLSAALGLELLRNMLARDIAFDNRVNGFTSVEVQSAIEEAQTAQLATFACASGVAVGDLVQASTSLDATVGTVTDLTYPYLVIGVVASKPSSTVCQVRVVGVQGGFSGLSRGRPVFVSATGTPTTAVPTGSHQAIGTAISATAVLFNFTPYRVLRP